MGKMTMPTAGTEANTIVRRNNDFPHDKNPSRFPSRGLRSYALEAYQKCTKFFGWTQPTFVEPETSKQHLSRFESPSDIRGDSPFCSSDAAAYRLYLRSYFPIRPATDLGPHVIQDSSPSLSSVVMVDSVEFLELR
ncbi:hypothetical protein CVT25_003052 [Psilocybe cyanescens]|uniref:Uncharacterized protein n=1 Tax=Psilocybe cyanescens TaxID=93625 RepID=A0A409WNC2_PSICY|nr:hypothetical protein CVT25_003052 [Psilocybe cyanescens]